MKLLRKISAVTACFSLLTASAFAADSSINVQCPDPKPDNVVCDHLVGGDDVATMADDAFVNDDGTIGGKKMYVFSFARLPEDEAPPINTSAYAGWVMEKGILAANSPAPTIMVDEGDELYLTLSNVGMAMRPDLFDPHTIHWHGFPQAAPIFDGVPDASISVNMGASLTYYYLGTSNILVRCFALPLSLSSLAAATSYAVVDGVAGPNVELTASEGRISILDGASVYFCGYSVGLEEMQLPGPTLTVNAGDTVTITLTNNRPTQLVAR